MWLDLPDQSSGGGGGIRNQERRMSENASVESTMRRHLLEEGIAGLILYRIENGLLEYLLLKKINENDWSPPKGHVEPGEDPCDGAEREVFEETGFAFGDYETLDQYPINFEYKSRQALKKVHLWAAKYLNFQKPLRLSPEHDEFQWLDYEASIAVVKPQYKEALMAADLVIRTFESL